MSSDPEWKHVKVRRLFIYVENSIDKATRWAVFEPNNERLWANIRSMMICLIGIAPTRPAEFVIFRVGQWTANAAS